ncbi:MAG: putative metal-sulfur cluster biosynthesis protein YuaD [Candidatus Parcubacteria bacterium]|jgi:hypothetical protein
MDLPTAIIPAIQLTGKVEWVGLTPPLGNSAAIPRKRIDVFQGQGVQYDKHWGTRTLDVRDEVAQAFGLKKGLECFNMRQWSAVSAEEVALIAADMGIPDIESGDLGENLIVSGIPNFTLLPPGTLIFFKDARKDTRTTILCVYAENQPCYIPAQIIQAKNKGVPGLVGTFDSHARNRRGLVGWTMCSGIIKPNDTVIAYVPAQRPYLAQMA